MTRQWKRECLKRISFNENRFINAFLLILISNMVETNVTWKAGSDGLLVPFTNQTTDGVSLKKKKEPNQEDQACVM